METARHDIANSVSALNGYIGLLLMEGEKSGGKQEEYLKKMEVICNKDIMNAINLLKEGGSNSWQHLPEMIMRCNIPSGIRVTAEEGVGNISIFANSLAFKAFENLIYNTLRHGRKAAKITIGSYLSGDDLVIVYSDDGIGVPQDEKKRIFEEGFGHNTGMGLFLVKSILGITGMQILENGEPGTGVRFEIRVPQGSYRLNKP